MKRNGMHVDWPMVGVNTCQGWQISKPSQPMIQKTNVKHITELRILFRILIRRFDFVRHDNAK